MFKVSSVMMGLSKYVFTNKAWHLVVLPLNPSWHLILKQLARLLHRGAEGWRSGDAREPEFSQRTDGDASPCFPIEHAVMVLVLFP